MAFDGIVAHVGLDPDLIARINAIVPVVLVNDIVEGLGVSSLMPDEKSGIRQALAYLRALGHERIMKRIGMAGAWVIGLAVRPAVISPVTPGRRTAAGFTSGTRHPPMVSRPRLSGWVVSSC